jgi:RHS repeat-associated protein
MTPTARVAHARILTPLALGLLVLIAACGGRSDTPMESAASHPQALSALDGCSSTNAASINGVAAVAVCIGSDATSNFVVFGYTNSASQANSDGEVFIPHGATNQIVDASPGVEPPRPPPTLFAAGGSSAALMVRYISTSGWKQPTSPPGWKLGNAPPVYPVEGYTPRCGDPTVVGGATTISVPGSTQLTTIALDPTTMLTGSVLPTQTPITGGRAAGELMGELSVTNTGSVNYTIALPVPPGRRGMQPTIGLSYDSTRPNGVVGVGWTLQGFSSIERCPQTLGEDGVISGIGALCLDADRLHDTKAGDWRPEHDPFTRVSATKTSINAVDNYATFLVQRRDGRSQVFVAPSVAANNPNAPRCSDRWLLSREEDLFHNAIEYDYEYASSDSADHAGEPCGAEIRPSRIRYTLDGSGASRKSIVFRYDADANGAAIARPDTDARYHNGALYVASSRLRAIEVHGPMPITDGIVSSYRLAYVASAMNGRSLLESVTACDGAGVCKSPTVFSYAAGESGFEVAKNSDGSDWTLPIATPFLTPTNQRSGGPLTGSLTATTSPPIVADLNGDGIDDLLYASGPELWHWYIRLGSKGSRRLGGDSHFRRDGVAPPASDFSEVIDTGFTQLGTMIPLIGGSAGRVPILSPSPLVYTQPNEPTRIRFFSFEADSKTVKVEDFALVGRTLTPSAGPPTLLGANIISDMDGDGQPDGISLSGIRANVNSGTQSFSAIQVSPSGRRSGMINLRSGFSCGEAPLLFARWDGVEPSVTGAFDGDISVKSPGELSGCYSPTYCNATALHDTCDYAISPLPTPPAPLPWMRSSNDDDVYPWHVIRLDTAYEATNSDRMYYRWHDSKNVAGDLNGDGNTDLAQWANGYISLFLSDGRSMAATPPTKLLSAGDVPFGRQNLMSPFAPLYVDFLEDGKPSMFLQNGAQWCSTDVTKDGQTLSSDECHGSDDIHFAPTRFFRLIYDASTGTFVVDNLERVPALAALPSVDARALAGSTDFGTQGRTLFSSPAFVETSAKLGPGATLDANGDGLTDLLLPTLVPVASPSPNGIQATAYKLFLRSGPHADRLIGVRAGMGDTSTIQYGTVTAGVASVTVPANCVYPVQCASPPLAVAQRIELHTQGSAKRSYSYSFEQPAFDLGGSGFLGFHSRTIRDEQTGTSTTITFDRYNEPFKSGPSPCPAARGGGWAECFPTLFPFARLPTHVVTQTRLASGAIRQSDVETTYNVIASPDAPAALIAWPAVTHSTQTETTGLRPAVLSDVTVTMTPDASGNIAEQKTLYNLSRDLDTVRRSFLTNTDAWLLSIPTAVSTTSCTTATFRSAGFVPPPCSGVEVRYDADPSTGLVKSALRVGDTDVALQVDFSYNNYGQLLRTTQTGQQADGASHSVARATEYDLVDGTFPRAIVDALGATAFQVYHPSLGVLVAAQGPDGVRRRAQVDGFGAPRLSLAPEATTAVVTPSVLTTSTDYIAPSNGGVLAVRRTSSVGANTTSIQEIDALGRVIYEYSGGAETTTLYDPTFVGQVARIDVRHQWTETIQGSGGMRPYFVPHDSLRSSYTYDNIGRPLTEQTSTAQRTYSYFGPISTITSTGTATRRFNADDRGRAIWSEEVPSDSASIKTFTDYGPDGRLARTVDADGHVLSINYDALGRTIATSDPDAGTNSTKYDAFGNVRQTIDGNLASVSFAYDDGGRLLARTAPDEQTCVDYVASGNGYGRRSWQRAAAASGDIVTEAWSYDGLGRAERVRQTVNGDEKAFTYSYDEMGRPAWLLYPVTGDNQLAVQYGYDSFGSMSSARGWIDGTPALTWARDNRNDLGMYTREQLGNGVEVLTQPDDPSGRVGTVTLSHNGARLANVQYGYDPSSSRLVSRDETISGLPAFGASYNYDGLGRITNFQDSTAFAPAWSVSYEYDSSTGSLARRTSSHIGGTRDVREWASVYSSLPAHGVLFDSMGSVYAYDNAGQLTSAHGLNFTWSSFGLPLTAYQGSPANGDAFVYDASQERVLDVNRATQTRIRSFGPFQSSVDGNGQTTYALTVGAAGHTIAQVTVTPTGTSGSNVVYVHDDGMGSPFLATDVAGAIVGEPRRYDPFGTRVLPADGSRPYANSNEAGWSWGPLRDGFGTHEAAGTFGLINMRGRVYDPFDGRFLSPDPIRHVSAGSQFLNPYSYLHNHGPNGVDPSGFDAAEGAEQAPWQPDAVQPGGASGLCPGECPGGSSPQGPRPPAAAPVAPAPMIAPAFRTQGVPLSFLTGGLQLLPPGLTAATLGMPMGITLGFGYAPSPPPGAVPFASRFLPDGGRLTGAPFQREPDPTAFCVACYEYDRSWNRLFTVHGEKIAAEVAKQSVLLGATAMVGPALGFLRGADVMAEVMEIAEGGAQTFRFAHGTSAAGAAALIGDGLNARAAIAATKGGTALARGSFFAMEVPSAGPGGEGFQLAYEFALRSAQPTVVIGEIPIGIATQLLQSGALRVLPLTGEIMPQLVFAPRSFALVNANVTWIASVPFF